MARPSKPKLSTTAIAEAALQLVDAQGELTLPQLAKALSVSASSLYNHVQALNSPKPYAPRPFVVPSWSSCRPR